MGFSLLAFIIGTSVAVVFLLTLATKLYLEISAYSTELKDALNKQILEKNKIKAQFSILQTKYNKLSLIDIELNKEKEKKEKSELQAINLQKEIQNLKRENSFLKNFEKELKKQESEYSKHIESLGLENKKLLEKIEKLKASIEVEHSKGQKIGIENNQLIEQLNEIKKQNIDLNSIFTQQCQNMDESLRNLNILKMENETLIKEKHKILTTLETIKDENSQLLSKLNFQESKSKSINSERKKEPKKESVKVEELRNRLKLKTDFEKKMKKRILNAHSIILNLEKKNLALNNKIERIVKQSTSLQSQNVIAFPQSSSFQEIASEVYKINSLLKRKGNKNLDDIELLKTKIDEARKSLFELQNSEFHFDDESTVA